MSLPRTPPSMTSRRASGGSRGLPAARRALRSRALTGSSRRCRGRARVEDRAALDPEPGQERLGGDGPARATPHDLREERGVQRPLPDVVRAMRWWRRRNPTPSIRRATRSSTSSATSCRTARVGRVRRDRSVRGHPGPLRADAARDQSRTSATTACQPQRARACTPADFQAFHALVTDAARRDPPTTPDDRAAAVRQWRDLFGEEFPDDPDKGEGGFPPAGPSTPKPPRDRAGGVPPAEPSEARRPPRDRRGAWGPLGTALRPADAGWEIGASATPGGSATRGGSPDPHWTVRYPTPTRSADRHPPAQRGGIR